MITNYDDCMNIKTDIDEVINIYAIIRLQTITKIKYRTSWQIQVK